MVSFASEPEPVKNTWLNCGGVTSASMLRQLDRRRVARLEEAVVVRQLEHLLVRRVASSVRP